MSYDFDDDSSAQYLMANWGSAPQSPSYISCWFNMDEAATGHALVFVGDKDVSDYNWSLRAAGANTGDPLGIWRHRYSGADGDFASTTTGYTAGTWHNAQSQLNSDGSTQVWIDGGSTGSQSDTVTIENHDRIAIGMDRDSSPGLASDGSIAHVGVWDATVAADGRARLAAGVSPLMVQPADLVFYWAGTPASLVSIVSGLTLSATGPPTYETDEPPVHLTSMMLMGVG